MLLQEGGSSQALGATHTYGAGGVGEGKEIFPLILLNSQKNASCTKLKELVRRGSHRMKPLVVQS